MYSTPILPHQVFRCMLQHTCGVVPEKLAQKLLEGLLYISYLTHSLHQLL